MVWLRDGTAALPQYRAASRHSWQWRFASLDRGGPTRSRSSPCSDPPQGQRRCCFTLTYSGIILKRLSGAHFFEDPASRLCLRFRRVPESHDSASIWDSSSSHGVSENFANPNTCKSRVPRVLETSRHSGATPYLLVVAKISQHRTRGGHWTRL